MTIKKIIPLIFCLSLVSLVGCTNNTQQDDPNDEPLIKEDITSQYLEINYYHDSEIKNSAEGLLLIRKKENIDLSSFSLSVKWGNDNNAFKDYDSLFSIENIKATEYEYEFKENSLIPIRATKLWVEILDKNDIVDKGTIDVTAYKKDVELVTSFEVISDQQVNTSTKGFYRRSVKAFKDIKENNPNSFGIFVNGDIVDECSAANYDEFYKSYAEVFKENEIPMYVGIGNHEFIKQSENAYYEGMSESQISKNFNERLNLRKEKTGNESQYYSIDNGDMKFIFLGTTRMPMALDGNSRADCYLGEEQLLWLESEINQSKDKKIFIMSHGSLRDTVSGSLTSLKQTWYGYNKEEESKIREIIDGKDNVYFFSSHSHWCFESENPYLIEEGGPSFFNTGAIGYLWEGNGDGKHYKDGNYENGGAQGLYVEVYKDQIHIKGREFEDVDGTSQYWFSNYQVVIEI